MMMILPCKRFSILACPTGRLIRKKFRGCRRATGCGSSRCDLICPADVDQSAEGFGRRRGKSSPAQWRAGAGILLAGQWHYAERQWEARPGL